MTFLDEMKDRTSPCAHEFLMRSEQFALPTGLHSRKVSLTERHQALTTRQESPRTVAVR